MIRHPHDALVIAGGRSEVKDRRTKLMAGGFILLVGYGFVSRVVFPEWIKPILTLDEDVAERRQELDELQERQEQFERAKDEYTRFIERIGSTDVERVEVDLRARLNTLIEKHKLKGAKVSGGRVRHDSKTGLKRVFLDVTATTSMESAVLFLKDMAELPHMVRITRPKISPASASRQKRKLDRVNLSVPIEVMVLPPQKKVIGRIDETQLVQPASYVRHQDRNYALIWERRPFIEYEPPKPLALNVKQPALTVKVGARARLQATATGGDGDYTYKWTPSEGLTGETTANPTADTSKAGRRAYSVTVTDGQGETDSKVVTLTVNERVTRRRKPRGKTGPPPPPPPPPDPRWPDRKHMQLCMTLITNDGLRQVNEFMVYDSKSRMTNYYRVGDEFDGGELVFVHQRGGVVVRKDEYFVYPIGANLDQAIGVDGAIDHPQLQAAAARHREAQAAEPAGEAQSVAEPGSNVVAPKDEAPIVSDDAPKPERPESAEEGARKGTTDKRVKASEKTPQPK